jgi:hypothetical protein
MAINRSQVSVANQTSHRFKGSKVTLDDFDELLVAGFTGSDTDGADVAADVAAAAALACALEKKLVTRASGLTFFCLTSFPLCPRLRLPVEV